MNLHKKRVGDVIVIYLVGRFDIYVSANIENEIFAIIEEEPDCHILLNLQEIDQITSPGLKVFISLQKKFEKTRNRLKLCNMSETVKAFFEVIEIIDDFEVHKTEELALKSFVDE
ncbi:MAG: STAS domain-containing protein [bacterium]|nr:STAS domain-containing protein [bacterium]